MDICYFIFRNAFIHKFLLNIIIYAEIAFFLQRICFRSGYFLCISTVLRCTCCLMRYAKVTENYLSKLFFGSILINAEYVLYALIQLCIRIILKGRVDQARIQAELTSV